MTDTRMMFHDKIFSGSTPEWTPEDHVAALKEGWLLSHRLDDGYWQIQRYDDGDKGWSDFEAYAYVREMADTKESETHRKAIILHGTKVRIAS